jgi:hypothetical protein
MKTASAALIVILGSTVALAQTGGTVTTTRPAIPKEKAKFEPKASDKKAAACNSRAEAYMKRYGEGGERYSGPTPAPKNYNEKIYLSALDNCLNTD